jgi:hypothetical protein
MISLPRQMLLRQRLTDRALADPAAEIRARLAWLDAEDWTNRSVAVGLGSRGIDRIALVARTVVGWLRDRGARPFIIPAMGSHGGATPEGQREVLESYGITEQAMQAPINPSLEVRQIGTTSEGTAVYCSVEALNADGVVMVNRIKPHTDFSGALGSGILKMCVIGLGKRTGAATMHGTASRLGYEPTIRAMARISIEKAPILCGVAILENQFHETAKLVVLPREQIESGEGPLLADARELMPLLPFEEIDLLIIDQLGKNISGAGMDPNVTGRWVHGYSSSLARENRPAPFIRRIFVRDLTPETHGNAIGIGFADVTTSRLVRAMNGPITYVNALTALTPQGAKIPIHFETDREAIERSLGSLALDDTRQARVVRILDTLSLAEMQASETLAKEIERRADLAVISAPVGMEFDSGDNLVAMRSSGRPGS